MDHDRRKQEHHGGTEQHLRERVFVEKQSLETKGPAKPAPDHEQEDCRDQKLEGVVDTPEKELTDRTDPANLRPPEDRGQADAEQQAEDIHCNTTTSAANPGRLWTLWAASSSRDLRTEIRFTTCPLSVW